jgi:hypothetical protein
MSSSRFGPPPGGSRWPNKSQRNNSRSGNGNRWGKPTWCPSSQRQAVIETAQREMLILQKPFVRGMVLDGCGLETVKPQRFRGGTGHAGFYNQVGQGTIEDPIVTWLTNPVTIDGIDAKSIQTHVDISRKVAKENGFSCIMIRKESHTARTTRTATGQRQTYRKENGIEAPVILPADLHITVYMGPNPRSAMVEGHIYVHKVWNPMTGCLELKKLDDPATERNPKNLPPGAKLVAEEFWITQGNWEVVPKEAPAAEKAKAAEYVQAVKQPEGLNVVEEEEEEPWESQGEESVTGKLASLAL